MINFLLRAKTKKELYRFKQFKKNFKFEMPIVNYKSDGSIFINNECLRNGEEGWVGETENFINVGYKIHGALPKVLSNLSQYEFFFRGIKVQSVESIFQSLKFKEKKLQKMIFKYYGLSSNYVKACSNYNWKETGYVYFLGNKIKRESADYDDFVDEIYVSLLQNPLFVGALKNVQNKVILHLIGTEDKRETLFTRFEFENELNALKEYVKFINKNP